MTLRKLSAILLPLSLLSACATSKTPSTAPTTVVVKCPDEITAYLPERPRAPANTPVAPQTGEWYGTVLLPWVTELERRFREGQKRCKNA